MRAIDKNKDTVLDINNLSSRKLWELLNHNNNLSYNDKAQLKITLRTRRHYEQELDQLQPEQGSLH
ncbi:hypothetical protein [Dasania marina]|uniref:hypothetical protein n=1 Tax=Dasania marina TaxID=471499 RepID=UPI0030D85431|tara:strand:+ start:34787 stop:34984 length:198 start_codon:yes stop_codon:yes gene_type:complete